jgi:glutaredoxin 2
LRSLADPNFGGNALTVLEQEGSVLKKGSVLWRKQVSWGNLFAVFPLIPTIQLICGWFATMHATSQEEAQNGDSRRHFDAVIAGKDTINEKVKADLTKLQTLRLDSPTVTNRKITRM